jgi:hypothetical protein
MGGHVRMDKDLVDDWRVLSLADVLLDEWLSASLIPGDSKALRDAACNAVLGGIYRLWRYADTHLRRYDRLNLALHGVAQVTLLPEAVLSKFPKEWLVDHRDGTVELPGYTAKNALIDKDNRREKTRERVKRWRQRKKEAGAEKWQKNGNAAERYEDVTTGSGPGPGTGTGPSGTGTGPGDHGASPAAGPGAAAPRKSFDEDFESRFGSVPLAAKA